MAKQQTAVAKKPDSSSSVPSFMQQDIGKGQDRIDRNDLEVPRLKLIQSVSKELDAYNKLRPGMFFHAATETIFDKLPVRVVPIFYERKFLLWNPLDSGGGILARAEDGEHWSPPNVTFDVKLDKKYGGKAVKWKTADTVEKSGLANWGTMDPSDPGSQPAATLMLNFLFGFPDYPDELPAVFTFQRSAIKAGRKFNTRLKTNRTPMFGLVFELSTTKASNSAQQSFYMPVLTGAGDLRDNEALYNEYRDMNAGFSERGMQIKDEGELQGEAAVDTADTDEPDDKPSATGRAKPKY